MRSIRRITGLVPRDLVLYKIAFNHRSNANLSHPKYQSNERLEYLGDAVLSMIVGDFVFRKYPYASEGFLTKMRSKIVQRRSLNELAYNLKLDDLLSMFNPTRISNTMMGNALEALVGAVYLDYGFEKTRRFVIRKILLPFVDFRQLEQFDDNYKSQLLEYCQKENVQIHFQLLERSKVHKRDCFKVAVLIEGKKVGEATEFSKKSAEQLASYHALVKMGLLDEHNGYIRNNSNG